MKKKGIIITTVLASLCVVGGVFAWKHFGKGQDGSSKDVVYVESVANITGMGNLTTNRYMGQVESQEVKGVNKDSEKKVKEILVSIGDEVKEGDPLFTYDTEEMELKLKQLQLELTSINNSITTAYEQINTLSKERDQAAADYKIEYTSQIQSLQAQINQYNYDASAKQLEIDRHKASMENVTVVSPMSGIIKNIKTDSNGAGDNQGAEDYYGGYGNNNNAEDNYFISIMALGDYRIKATTSELNIRTLSVGDPVIVRSRIDENEIWTGSISSIDTEHSENQNNDYYGGYGGETATNYPFYISLDSIDNLMLGQHVSVEPDYGQGVVKEGLWLADYYVVNEAGDYYVWMEKDEKLKKQPIEVGEYDSELCQYEILSGLTTDDYIAYPEERLLEGMKTTHNYDEVVYSDAEGDYSEGDYSEDGYYEEGNYEDGYSEDGNYEEGYSEENYSEEYSNEDGEESTGDDSVKEEVAE